MERALRISTTLPFSLLSLLSLSLFLPSLSLSLFVSNRKCDPLSISDRI